MAQEIKFKEVKEPVSGVLITKETHAETWNEILASFDDNDSKNYAITEKAFVDAHLVKKGNSRSFKDVGGILVVESGENGSNAVENLLLGQRGGGTGFCETKNRNLGFALQLDETTNKHYANKKRKKAFSAKNVYFVPLKGTGIDPGFVEALGKRPYNVKLEDKLSKLIGKLNEPQNR